MKVLQEAIIPYNTGKSFIVKRGQRIRISAESVVDFICFNLDNLKDKFDQARTKIYNGKIFISTGDKVFSNHYNHMMTFVDDTYKGLHDLQCPMCSKQFYDQHYEWFKAGDPVVTQNFGDFLLMVNKREDLPDHGCWENMQAALKDYDINPEEMPNPLDLFQNMKIVGPSGNMVVAIEEVRPKPDKPAHVDFSAEMDCLVALSACPEFFVETAYGKSAKVQVYDE